MVSGLFGPEPSLRRRYTDEEKQPLYIRQKGKCNGCETKFPMRNLTVDHIRSLARGGIDRLSNWQLLCGSCNSIKNEGTQSQLRKRLVEKGVLKEPVTSKTAKKSASKSKSKSTR